MLCQYAEVLHMLKSYSAQITGEQIIWLDQPPPCLPGARVLVVVEDDEHYKPQKPTKVKFDLTDLAGRLEWKGDAVAAQRAQRDAW